jgi:hypothetical protein
MLLYNTVFTTEFQNAGLSCMLCAWDGLRAAPVLQTQVSQLTKMFLQRCAVVHFAWRRTKHIHTVASSTIAEPSVSSRRAAASLFQRTFAFGSLRLSQKHDQDVHAACLQQWQCEPLHVLNHCRYGRDLHVLIGVHQVIRIVLQHRTVCGGDRLRKKNCVTTDLVSKERCVKANGKTLQSVRGAALGELHTVCKLAHALADLLTKWALQVCARSDDLFKLHTCAVLQGGIITQALPHVCCCLAPPRPK